MPSMDEILKNFKTEESVIRGKIYTFKLRQNSSDYSTKEWFYLTTTPPEQRVNAFDGVITDGVSISKELISNPDLNLLEDPERVNVQLSPFTHWKPQPLPTNGWNAVSTEYGITYNQLGYFVIDSSQTETKKVSYVQTIPAGYYYQYCIDLADISGGNIKLQLGTEQGTALTSSGFHKGILNTTHIIPGTPLNFSLVYDQDFTGKILYISLKRVGACDESLIFAPSFIHPDTIYYESSNTLEMGNKINVLNTRGPIKNSEERYYTLGINQTNRTYAPIMKSDPKIVTKFLQEGLPGGLFKNIFNRAPSGTVSADRASTIYYDPPNGDKTVSLSGLISDPENDTLNYRWSHFAPKKTMDGVSLLTTFEDPTSLETEATLVTPPTDMIYTLHLEVADSDNITTIPINVKVSGTIDFENWAIGSGINTFDLGDSNVPFDDLD